jgi:hypothetical protein
MPGFFEGEGELVHSPGGSFAYPSPPSRQTERATIAELANRVFDQKRHGITGVEFLRAPAHRLLAAPGLRARETA